MILIIGAYLWMTYNNLIVLQQRIKEALSQIDVLLKRRSDLIPNLVETVKGYEKHEKEVFENVTKARSNMVKADSLSDKAEASDQLSNALKSVFAVAEAYPDLKASENFKELQDELTDTENKIAYSRQFYNSTVLSFNTARKQFPGNIFAKQLGFTTDAEFFTATDDERKEVKVKF